MHDLYIAEIYRPGDAISFVTDNVSIIFIDFYTASSGKVHRARWCVTVVLGHSRSSKLLPIESPYATSYQSSVVTICIFSVVSEIRYIRNQFCRNFHIGLLSNYPKVDRNVNLKQLLKPCSARSSTTLLSFLQFPFLLRSVMLERDISADGVFVRLSVRHTLVQRVKTNSRFHYRVAQ